MPSIDMPLDQLRQYKPSLNREADFDSFWSQTLAESQKQPLQAELIPYALPARDLECYAVRFNGFGGGRIAGWYMRPAAPGPFPALMIYHGYSGRGNRPLDLVAQASQGFCVMSMDTRGQIGDSQDISPAASTSVGWMTKGIADPKTYYYRYVYTDAVRALEVLAAREEVDATRIAVTGGSQGGAITMAAASLSDRPVLSLPDIPFLCDFRRSVAITSNGPFPEIANFCKHRPEMYEQAFRTLSYFDLMNLAPRTRCRTVICNCLWDDICPPSGIYAAYNHMTCVKSMEVYPFHKHEIPYEQYETKFRLLMEMQGAKAPSVA